jgi:hypothetical protein
MGLFLGIFYCFLKSRQGSAQGCCAGADFSQRNTQQQDGENLSHLAQKFSAAL